MLCGVAQTEPRLGEPERNVESCLARLEEAASVGCDLVVLPECATTGYMFASEDEAGRYAEEIPGPSAQALAEACARHGLHCVAGLLERDGDRLRNTAVLLGPEGLLGRYRKTHLPFLGVDRFVVPGEEPSEVVDPFGNRLGEAGEREDELVFAEIEPAEARDKHRAIVPGEYEVDLFDDRRPELYGALVEERRPAHIP
jgi:predicted amidohydrolase